MTTGQLSEEVWMPITPLASGLWDSPMDASSLGYLSSGLDLNMRYHSAMSKSDEMRLAFMGNKIVILDGWSLEYSVPKINLGWLEISSPSYLSSHSDFLSKINQGFYYSFKPPVVVKANYEELTVSSPRYLESDSNFLSKINELYNFVLEKTKSIPSCKVENSRLCLSVHFRCVEEKIWRGHIKKVTSELAHYQDIRLTQGRKWVEVSVALPEKVMKQMKFLPPGMGAGAYSPRRKAVAYANYKKLMCLVDELSKTCRASSSSESMKEPSRTNLSEDNDLERKCPPTLSKFDEIKADDGSLSPIVENPDSTFMTESCVQVSEVVPKEVMKEMPIPPLAMAAASYPPPLSAVSIAEYEKLMCLVDELSKTFKASSLLESTKESSRAYLSVKSDSERRCPSASSKFDEIKMSIPPPTMAAGSYPPPRSAISIVDYKKLMCLVDELSKTFKASSLLESKKESSPTYLRVESDSEMRCPSVSSKFDQIKMPISPPAVAAGSYPPSRSVVSIVDNNKLMCLVDQHSKTFKALPWLESMKESSPTYFSADNLEQVQVSDVLLEEVMIQMSISPPAMRKKSVVFLDYVRTISPLVANFLNYANTSYANTSYAMKIVILFIISMITITVFLFWLRSTTPPPPQDTTLDTILETWPNFFPQDAFSDCCPICLTRFDDEQEGEDNTLGILPDCRHVFHVKCLDQWLREHPTCPMCRMPVMLG